VLGHCIEESGIATTGISLIRPHTEAIRPPRALWVPFQLGRPLGAPEDPSFQKRVLAAVLGLLEAESGPLLEDYSEEEPESDAITVLACPVNFAAGPATDTDEDRTLLALRREITAMRPWYDMAVARRRRTTVGVSGIDVGALGDFIYAFIGGAVPPNPRDDTPLAQSLKLAVEDLKAYYFEGITAQPGQSGASSRALQDWFWDETVAGGVLLDLKKACEASPDELIGRIGSHFIVPGDVARRHGV
jgi:hypothetical protein